MPARRPMAFALMSASAATALATVVAGCAATASSDPTSETTVQRSAASETTVQHPAGAATPRAAIDAFLRALEHRDTTAMRQMMTPDQQEIQGQVVGGLLLKQPLLTSYRILRFVRESPRGNASPHGSIASRRYTVALTPSSGFDSDGTAGSAYDILVSEGHNKQWLVAELGGCC